MIQNILTLGLLYLARTALSDGVISTSSFGTDPATFDFSGVLTTDQPSCGSFYLDGTLGDITIQLNFTGNVTYTASDITFGVFVLNTDGTTDGVQIGAPNGGIVLEYPIRTNGTSSWPSTWNDNRTQSYSAVTTSPVALTGASVWKVCFSNDMVTPNWQMFSQIASVSLSGLHLIPEPTSAPSVVPTYAPTDQPTTPTGIPTSSPTFSPTNFPTNSPTFAPTDSPTSSPSAAPTDFPTGSPTTTPTGNPTQYQCVVDILLYDMFGDGWGNSQLVVTADGITTNYTLECGHCDRITLRDYCAFSLHIETTDGKEPTNPWEHFWVVGALGQTIVGSFYTSIKIDEKGPFARRAINYNKTFECEECAHPKPKPPAKKHGKSGHDDSRRNLAKKAPSLATVKLYDEKSDGWFVSRGWNDVCDAEVCTAGDTSCMSTAPKIPGALVYPRYFIVSKDKTELIHEGTICSGSRGFEVCQNNLPEDGEYVFRVAGVAPDNDDPTWEFCGKTGGLEEELQFRIKDGKCIPGARITSTKYCAGLQSSVVLTGSLLFSDVRTSFLSSADTTVLEKDIGLVIPSSSIAIKSWTQSNEGLRVHFSAAFTSDKELVYFPSNVDNLISNVETSLSSSISTGVFGDQLASGLLGFAGTQNDALRSSSSITLEEVSLFSVSYLDTSDAQRSSPIEIVTAPVETTTVHTKPSGTIYTITSVGVYALVTVGIVLLGVAGVAVRYLSRKRTHDPLPTDSAHADNLSA